jgi:glutamyl-Q tRNA(Asp) synthetase
MSLQKNGPWVDVEALKAACPTRPITRFAPSPTGYLHLGHVLSMAFVFGFSDLLGSKVLLRIEDHDRQRCRKEYEQAIIDDMAWLGFIPDNWTEVTQAHGTSAYRQSDCSDRYQAAIRQLGEQNQLYYCGCSRKHIVAMAAQEAQELFYPGTCRNKNLEGSQGRSLRLRIGEESYSWNDLFAGPKHQKPAQQCGDLLLQDHLGNYTYNFAVAVDDLDQGVNLVVRGEDLLHCTARQILLRELLGTRPQTIFAHHPILTDALGKKLSKRVFSEGIIQRRLNGERARDVLGEALWLAGVLPKQRPVAAHEVSQILIGNY